MLTLLSLHQYLQFYISIAEISNLFAPAVSDDESSNSSKKQGGAVSPDNTLCDAVDYSDHPGSQVAFTAAAIDQALTSNKAVTPTSSQVNLVTTISPNETDSNKRPLPDAMDLESTIQQPALKRRVSVEGASKRITLSSACGAQAELASAFAEASRAKGMPTPTIVHQPPLVPSTIVKKEEETTAPKPASKTTKKAPTKKATTTSTKVTTNTKTGTTKSTGTTTISIKSSMTPEEKAQACRERNREHARKTRLRKKAYVDELKRSLNELVEQRDAAKAEEERRRQVLEQNRDVRFQVMQDFLNLRGTNEQSSQRWGAILVDEEFQLRLPPTDFQTMVARDGSEQQHQQVLSGVHDVMADASYFAAFLQTLTGEDNEAAAPVYAIYSCDRESFFMDGCQAVVNFEVTSCGGAKGELISMGTFRAIFCPETNRLRSAQMVFDTASIRQQLPALTGPASN